MFNLETIRSFTDNDDNALREILQSFMDNSKQNISLLKKALEDNDAPKIRTQIHKLRNFLGMIEAKELAQLAGQIDSEEGEKWTPETFFQKVQDFLAKFDILFLELEKTINQLIP